MIGKYKIGDKFAEAFEDLTYYITIIGIAPELDSEGNITYFTKIEYGVNELEGFYFDAQSQRYLEEETDKMN